MLGAGIERLVEFGAGADFDFDIEGGGANSLDGVADSAGGGDVIVFDEDGVEESHAVVGDAACGRRGFFERAQPRGGLAGIENAAIRSSYKFGELARQD